ncbi:S49 family peptidase [Bergeyella zoohelcum]|uniref:Signal peptide peptidase SppA, 36K type n=1 Tax=Bergeyella zoohelcum TaxID=1015 RepID=A0A376BZP7_9FLAO|nr:S49 family peptidase [Bergeyella zoohelcum]EKB60751.1 hypothetical protein HMPREF9700_00246 [Bergeyella zoohelcum CCUG 30536]SSZ47158.1 signal peptide peptidase SppA, 36K type [Bergeyella zoohelcum]
MFGNTFFNTPLAIDKGYLLALIPSLLSEYALVKANAHNPYIQEREDVFRENIKAQGKLMGNNHFPVVLNIVGPIVKYSSWYSYGTQFYGKLLKELDAHPQVSGIVLNIDSGGGMVSGTAELTNIIKNLTTPTISYTSGYQCSAALDIASGCDYHMASPYADLIGSIGTMLSYQDFSAMFEKWGAKIYELYAPQSTEKNQEWRELMKGNEALYTERLRMLAQDFIDRMKENFGEDLKDDGHVFKGKTYTPQEALAIGLIDELGTLEDALSKF